VVAEAGAQGRAKVLLLAADHLRTDLRPLLDLLPAVDPSPLDRLKVVRKVVAEVPRPPTDLRSRRSLTLVLDCRAVCRRSPRGAWRC
jgi:hypothetical protein